ncbi:FtsK/SpoIIIE domain-containing protein [Phytohabitans rumicis]|uniref:FtsK domain-containing protein n=1 Tax=Phytohabitans rumicis TaxID=1076125 RepID=A0A6V8L310_9ACTN|nr:hypothetical protein Prum_029800 [Phytohabitans rumicis]
MPSSRPGLVADVRQDLSAARGLTRAALGAAETARVEAHGRRDKTNAEHGERLAGLVGARESARQDIRARFESRAGALAEELAAVAAECAPGAAGTSWRAWRPTEPERGRRPGLFRIGTLGHEPAGAGTVLPALVPLLDHAHLSFTGDPSTVDGMIAGLLLRVLGSTRPGEVRLTVYDPEQLGGSLAGFAPLGNADLLTFVGPGGLTGMLDDLVEQIRRINESVLAGEYASLAELTAATAARRPEPWRLVVLLGDAATAADLTAAQRAQLDRIVRTGVACGVHVLARGLPIEAHPTVEHVAVVGSTAVCGTAGDLAVRLDVPPAADRIAAVCRELAEVLLAGPPPAQFADLAPEKLWAECSAAGLVAPLGDGPHGDLVEVLLGDDPPHALIGGPSGSGKTNLIYAWLGALTARYSPDELALYLLDFKEGVSFARFAPGRRDPSWLPQVRLVGVNVNGDREFGLALLRHLADELRRRASAAKRHEATKLAELRAEDPSGHWPRIVAVIDEFQVLLAGRDAVANEAVGLLEDLARRGRSQGIHLVLASQDVSGIEALWGRSALVAQFTLRIALPKARRILAETNLAADVIPRFHAVVNADSGVPDANRIVRLPDASDRSAWRTLQEKLWHARPEGLEPPRLFDGDAVPPYPADLGAWRVWRPTAPCSARRSTYAPARRCCACPARRGATWPSSAPARTRLARCSARPGGHCPRWTRRRGSAWCAWTTTPPPRPPCCTPPCRTPAGTTPTRHPSCWPSWPRRRPALRTTSSGTPGTPRPGGCRPCATCWPAGRSGTSMCSAGGAGSPGSATTSVGPAPASTRSAPGWPWTYTATSWHRSRPSRAGRPGIHGRTGHSSSTVPRTAYPRSSSRTR